MVGDIALWNLPYAEIMLELNENVRVVALKRDKNDTIKSFQRWFGGLKHFPWVTFAERERMPAYKHMPLYDVCYPKYRFEAEQPTIKEGALMYYDDYYAQVDRLLEKYPNRVRMYDSYDILNRRDLMEDLFDFVNVAEPRDYNVVIGGHPTDLQAAHQASHRARNRGQDQASPLPVATPPPSPQHVRRRPQEYSRSFRFRQYRRGETTRGGLHTK
eukprot:8878358-Pyramimonas_sp.AAC.1